MQTYEERITDNDLYCNFNEFQNFNIHFPLFTLESKRSIPLELQSKIKTLALFIGYPRSGHTLISSLLDAHPHMVISNELDIFERWREWTLTEKTRENIFNRIYQNSQYHSQGSGFRSPTRNRGRTYAVPNQWQGRYENYIKVSFSTRNV